MNKRRDIVLYHSSNLVHPYILKVSHNRCSMLLCTDSNDESTCSRSAVYATAPTEPVLASSPRTNQPPNGRHGSSILLSVKHWHWQHKQLIHQQCSFENPRARIPRNARGLFTVHFSPLHPFPLLLLLRHAPCSLPFLDLQGFPHQPFPALQGFFHRSLHHLAWQQHNTSSFPFRFPFSISLPSSVSDVRRQPTVIDSDRLLVVNALKSSHLSLDSTQYSVLF